MLKAGTIRRKNNIMKTSNARLQEPKDLPSVEPAISFSHLALCFSMPQADDDDSMVPYGFPAPQEERLYETGVLAREFLKC